MEQLVAFCTGRRIAPKIRQYHYFDTPNGEDVGKKFRYAITHALYIAFASGTVDVMAYSKPTKVLSMLGRYAWISLPIVGVTTAFVLTTNFAKIYRDKEDYWNCVMGGYAGGAVLAAYRGKATSFWLWGTIFAITAICKKHAVDNNIQIISNELPPVLGTIKYVRHDCSLTRYRPGNYTVGPVGSVGPEE